ncbi:hypothetical protein [Mesorhizobium sp. M1378]|uniref:hypothetical protein n=1 Tax=Mesorhizobium sp. M1378 TaxID=2957092 RepID=UPI003337AD80
MVHLDHFAWRARLIASAQTQDADRAIRDTTTIIEPFEPPPRRPPSIAIAHAAPVVGPRWLADLRLFGSVDYGAVRNPPGRDYEFASLGSVGAGLRAGFGNHFNIATSYKDEAKLGLDGALFRVAAGRGLAVRPLRSDFAQRDLELVKRNCQCS